MCVAVPGKIVEINEDCAIVDFLGGRKKVNICLLEDISIGDFVLVHVGFAIEKIDEEESINRIDSFKEIINKIEENV